MVGRDNNQTPLSLHGESIVLSDGWRLTDNYSVIRYSDEGDWVAFKPITRGPESIREDKAGRLVYAHAHSRDPVWDENFQL
jgi:hypothetical protein